MDASRMDFRCEASVVNCNGLSKALWEERPVVGNEEAAFIRGELQRGLRTLQEMTEGLG